jgi:hypothetical protein
MTVNLIINKRPGFFGVRLTQLTAWIVLCVILNIVIFPALPGIPGSSQLRVHEDPVNSLAEFVIEVCLEIEDHLPGDEREAESGLFNLVKLLSPVERETIAISRSNYLLSAVYSLRWWSAEIPDPCIAILSPPPQVPR